jgi:hypothetical protein
MFFNCLWSWKTKKISVFNYGHFFVFQLHNYLQP